MADNKRTSEKVQVDNIEQMSGQEREVSSSNIQNDAVSSPSGDDPEEKVPVATIMAIFVSFLSQPLGSV
jgi:hypothetical protein